MNNSDITEQYLNKVYEDLSREQMSLMNSMKSQTNNEKDKLLRNLSFSYFKYL